MGSLGPRGPRRDEQSVSVDRDVNHKEEYDLPQNSLENEMLYDRCNPSDDISGRIVIELFRFTGL